MFSKEKILFLNIMSSGIQLTTNKLKCSCQHSLIFNLSMVLNTKFGDSNKIEVRSYKEVLAVLYIAFY